MPHRHLFVACCTLVGCFLLVAAPAPGGGPDHGFSGALFGVVVDGRQSGEHVMLSVQAPAGEPHAVDAQAVFLTPDPARRETRLALRTFSTRDTTITGARISGDTLAFDLHLDGRDADRKIRIRSIREGDGLRIGGSGLWADQTHTSFARVRWNRLERIELPFPVLGSLP